MNKEDVESGNIRHGFDYRIGIIKDEENSLSTKLNLFVVSESMLVITFVTALNLGVQYEIIPVMLVIIGLIVTFVFLCTIISYGRYISDLEERFKKDFPESGIKFHYFSYSTIGVILMTSFIGMWVMFFILILKLP